MTCCCINGGLGVLTGIGLSKTICSGSGVGSGKGLGSLISSITVFVSFTTGVCSTVCCTVNISGWDTGTSASPTTVSSCSSTWITSSTITFSTSLTTIGLWFVVSDCSTCKSLASASIVPISSGTLLAIFVLLLLINTSSSRSLNHILTLNTYKKKFSFK